MITEPTGNSPLAQWLRKLAREVNSQRLTSVFGGRFVRGAQGTQIIVEPGNGGPGARIRLLLCDGITGGPPKYYLVSATLDPDQTPTP